MTGHGGWPLSIFMTAEGKPFFAGTYFPKSSRMGMTGFMELLGQIASIWKNDRQKILNASDEITQAIQSSDEGKPDHPPGSATLKKGYEQLKLAFDANWGGFGAEPKFPTPHNLTFLLRWNKRGADPSALQMVEKTLDTMRRGGIFDQIGLGFHRYSVDRKWLVPHFEKMLYDQALLTMAYTETYQATRKAKFGRVVREILTYVLRDMTSPEGGFYCAEDADSEGKEGLFYVWTPGKVKKHLGDTLGDLFCRFYDISDAGNFEDGHSIPHIPIDPVTFAKKEGLELKVLEKDLEDARQKLFKAREKRIHPLKDDKILTAWNGLMIAALAKASQVFGDHAYADAAQKAVAFISKNLRTSEGRLLRRYRQGDAAYPGYLNDYAFLVWGLIELYEATFDVSYLEQADAVNREMIDIFWDKKAGGLYFTGKGNEPLVMQNKEIYDGALPSGNSVAALNFLRLGRMTGNIGLEKKYEELIRHFSAQVTAHPIAYTQLLAALDFGVGPNREIVISGDPALDETQSMIHTIYKMFMPNKVLLLRSQGSEGKRLAGLSPFTEFMTPVNHRPTVYVCEQYACQAPISDVGQLQAVLRQTP
jgi:uncharacterized protein YyaL (SSP411 family)